MITAEILCSFLPAFWFLQEQAAQLNNSSSSLLDLILRASPVAKFVLLILLIFSIASWAIIFAKARATKTAQQQSAQFLESFEKSSRWAELQASSARYGASPLTAIFLAAQRELEKQSRLNLEAVHRVMQSAAIGETTKLEKSLGWLASTASASPFIGLFGTVIGIIIAFNGLSQAATASIQVVAPGIAEALVATAGGLAVAIPAVICFNYFMRRVRHLSVEMEVYSSRFLIMLGSK